MKKRVILLVLDGVGVGINPSVKTQYVSNSTIGDVFEKEGVPNVPTLDKLGFLELYKLHSTPNKIALYGKMLEESVYLDSWAGHWELMGVKIDDRNAVYWKEGEGFCEEIIRMFENELGIKVIGNIAMNRREEVIYDYIEEHKKSPNSVIVLTEAGLDSVRTFQIYALPEIYNKKELYEICERAQNILGKYNNVIGRIGARPLVYRDNGKIGVENSERKDYLIFQPPAYTLLDALMEKSIRTIGIGKIYAMFKGQGICRTEYALTNQETFDKLIKVIEEERGGLIFVNFNDFDACYGHNFDTKGWINGLKEMDIYVEEILEKLSDDDIMIICSDGHGCDCVYTGLHTKEYSPIIIYNKKLKNGEYLGENMVMNDIACSIAKYFDIKENFEGKNLFEIFDDEGV